MKLKTTKTRQTNRLFEQVYEYIANRIERGEWKEHDKLPSVRSLAQEMNVHRLTVFKAYQLLKQNGNVYVKDKSGYFVQPQNYKTLLNDAIISSNYKASHLSAIHQVPAIYQFSKALIDPNLLPNVYLSEYVKKVFNLYPKVLGTYSPVQGDEELRKFMAHYFYTKHQFYLSKDELLITSGAQQAIDLIVRVFLKSRDAILIERPTYSTAIDCFRQQGVQIIPVDIYSDGYDIEQVKRYMKIFKPRLFYVNPTFHNPTGYTIPAEQRKQLVELAQQYRCLLVEDDSFHDIYFDQEPPLPIFAYDTEGCVIHIRGFSKYVAPGLRIAVVASHPEIMKTLIKAKSLADNGTPLLNQKIFLHYFSSERLQQHLEKLRTALQIRKEIMEEELADAGWEWTSPRGGLNLWVKLLETANIEEFYATSIKQSISFVPGVICDPNGGMTAWIRLSYSFINEQNLREGIRCLVRLYRSTV